MRRCHGGADAGLFAHMAQRFSGLKHAAACAHPPTARYATTMAPTFGFRFGIFASKCAHRGGSSSVSAAHRLFLPAVYGLKTLSHAAVHQMIGARLGLARQPLRSCGQTPLIVVAIIGLPARIIGEKALLKPPHR
jgi:hypothetical protein